MWYRCAFVDAVQLTVWNYPVDTCIELSIWCRYSTQDLELLWCQSLVWLMQASIWTLYLSFIHTLFPLCKDFWYLKPSWSSLRYPFILLIIIRISLLIFMYHSIQSSFMGGIVWFWHHDWRDINIFTCCINK